MFIGTNFPNTAEYSRTLKKHVESGLDPVRAFVEAELNYVELSLKHVSFDRAAFEADIQRLHEHGLQVNLHPYFNCQGFGSTDEHPRLRESMKTVLQIAHHAAQDEGRRVVINLHAASGRKSFQGKNDREKLVEQSIAFHQWLMEAANGLDVQITTEHQLPPSPQEGTIRIGDSFDELLTLRAATPHDQFHICWDMGHSAMRNAFYHADLYPPHELVTLVRHVHIHDVNFDTPVDHRPIGTAGSPLQDFVQSLLHSGYTGGFTMEYQADEFFGESYADFLRQSKAALISLVEEKHIL